MAQAGPPGPQQAVSWPGDHILCPSARGSDPGLWQLREWGLCGGMAGNGLSLAPFGPQV